MPLKQKIQELKKKREEVQMGGCGRHPLGGRSRGSLSAVLSAEHDQGSGDGHRGSSNRGGSNREVGGTVRRQRRVAPAGDEHPSFCRNLGNRVAGSARVPSGTCDSRLAH